MALKFRLLITFRVDYILRKNKYTAHQKKKKRQRKSKEKRGKKSETVFNNFSSVTQSCPNLCETMNPISPGLPVHHQLVESTQTHVHWACDAIQLSHPLSSASPPSLNIFRHQGLFKWVSSLHEEAKVLEFQLQHQSFQWTFRTNFL